MTQHEEKLQMTENHKKKAKRREGASHYPGMARRRYTYRYSHRSTSVWARAGHIMLAVAGLLLFTGAAFVVAGLFWLFRTWRDLNIDQILYQLQAPVQGTNQDMIRGAVLHIGVPAILAFCMGAVALYILFFRIRKHYAWTATAMAVVGLTVILSGALYSWDRLDVKAYMENRKKPAVLLDDNYVDPATVNITFPEKKRNLVYIVLESMETTYMDEANGGGFEKNVIPELTKLVSDNEDFSGSIDTTANGALPLNGSSWTIASLFSQTSGLPLVIPVEANSMSEQSTFFPQLTGIGDILEQQGYHQTFILGSDATFGGRRNYFRDHGNYEIMDHPYFQQTGAIPSDYSVFWGMEDEKLFTFARQKLTELAKSDEPFNLTLLTVDTHFEDGCLCRLCRDDFPGNQYANVMACSSRQVASFIEWIQEQPFYENTTIVLQGDHLTMDSDFCSDVPATCERKALTAYINAPVKPALDTRRQFSVLDSFPTTLAALGANIQGEQLGLGVNLFSNHLTLTEQYGVDRLNEEFIKKSAVMDELYTTLKIE